MKTIIENNKLIADFMDVERIVGSVKNGKVDYYLYLVFIPQYSAETKFMKISELRYEKDWNWLMEVVSKIESLGYVVNIQGISCSINRLLETETIVQWVLGDKSRKIELVYTTIVEFIKWYNQQNITNNSNI